MGPDGPDFDDWIQLQAQTSSTPEPVSFVLGGIGLAAIAAMRLWQMRFRFSFANAGMRRQAAVLSEDTSMGVEAGSSKTSSARKGLFRRSKPTSPDGPLTS
jgi:hypothetical protein